MRLKYNLHLYDKQVFKFANDLKSLFGHSSVKEHKKFYKLFNTLIVQEKEQSTLNRVTDTYTYEFERFNPISEIQPSTKKI